MDVGREVLPEADLARDRRGRPHDVLSVERGGDRGQEQPAAECAITTGLLAVVCSTASRA
ncbi:hypothetical protein LWP59_09100 [Amycolatopsis acidiphila]|nr:hypothetical protein [Amycolatopsis acidiphila]UIJ61758.1 hypothetical protein LWP59_09100 [Amycolatopsis acidiphila]GHG58029.1 hypothetical protein GCM10017788_10280 [Amycolatopsis acidiphila]